MSLQAFQPGPVKHGHNLRCSSDASFLCQRRQRAGLLPQHGSAPLLLPFLLSFRIAADLCFVVFPFAVESLHTRCSRRLARMYSRSERLFRASAELFTQRFCPIAFLAIFACVCFTTYVGTDSKDCLSGSATLQLRAFEALARLRFMLVFVRGLCRSSSCNCERAFTDLPSAYSRAGRKKRM